MNATTSKKSAAAHLAPVRAASGLSALESEINAAFPERREVVRAILAATVAGEHTVVIGPPGTAKSELARSFAESFGSSYFEKLMTRFTTPEEVFGPVKLSALQQDRFARATAGYLPTAEIVFLDEIFKANSAILNALLTALNERVFHDDGGIQTMPLVSCIAASNELPEGPELDALYDRFMVRCVTSYIADRDTFAALLTSVASGVRATVGTKVDIRAEQAAARSVIVTPETVEAIVSLRKACGDKGLAVSDRRWVKCLSLVRAAAHLDGRTSTSPDDLEVLEHVLWRKPDERHAVTQLVQTTINPSGAAAVRELDAAREILAKAPTGDESDKIATIPQLAQATEDLKKIAARVASLGSGRRVDAVKAEVDAVKKEIAKRTARAAGLAV